MANSKLVSYTKLSPFNYGVRTHSIDRISPHCAVGQCGVEALGNLFQTKWASSNYGIGYDGKVAMYVPEDTGSMCTSDFTNDNRAVTIECASDPNHPYAFNDKVYGKLVELCVDICKRNGKDTLIWIADKQKSLDYKLKSNEMLITVHRWFEAKACPGDWLYNRLGKLAEEVTKQLQPKPVDYYVTVNHTTKIAHRVEPKTKVKILAKIKNKTKLHIKKEKDGFGYCKYNGNWGWVLLKYCKLVK